ncbi:protein patched homolog 2 isoform X8 [Meles meles]|uniref:protein patched homolog 2 isoform X8 n=1 Tax=Meles meles TaxID=9662 RepID=UPI001E69F369|nr:protein patched homolog 2 isoform X8 [Meles meles]
MARPPPLQELPPGYTPPARAASPQILAGSLKSPLWLRAYFQGLLFSLGCGIQRHCGKVLFLGLLAFGALALGLRVAIIETDLEQLWVEVGSRVSQELHYTKEKLGEEAAYTSQMLIQTPRQEGENVLTPEALDLHLQAALTASKVQVSLYGKSWDLNKICYKSGIPLIENGMIERMIEKLFPCVILTPLDCFWEGAKLQGGSAYLPGRPDIQWTNLDPEQLLEELGPFASLEGFRELLDKAQVGQAYVGRPCLHPDDLHCPPSAPNHRSKQAPKVAQELSGGCHGFSHKFMHWQEELLLGGIARDPQGQLLRGPAEHLPAHESPPAVRALPRRLPDARHRLERGAGGHRAAGLAAALCAASLCLCDNAALGLCPVPGCSGPCRGAAGSPGSGLGPWALRPARHHLQCRHYPGATLLGTGHRCG